MSPWRPCAATIPTSSWAWAPRRASAWASPTNRPPASWTPWTFLDKVRSGAPMDLGRRVLIIGGGNSAMDAARSARRLVKDGEVTLVYRRTRAQMPADPAEVVDCLEEGIGLRDLLAPASVVVDGGRAVGLACTKMNLGERDASGPAPAGARGRARGAPARRHHHPRHQPGAGAGLPGGPGRAPQAGRHPGRGSQPPGRPASQGLFAGGDAVHGPASVIQAIADGRAAAETIGRRHGLEPVPSPSWTRASPPPAPWRRRARTTRPRPCRCCPSPSGRASRK